MLHLIPKSMYRILTLRLRQNENLSLLSLIAPETIHEVQYLADLIAVEGACGRFGMKINDVVVWIQYGHVSCLRAEGNTSFDIRNMKPNFHCLLSMRYRCMQLAMYVKTESFTKDFVVSLNIVHVQTPGPDVTTSLLQPFL